MKVETEAREDLFRRFDNRLRTSNRLDRKLISYQGNKQAPGFRWMKYKEGFSSRLVEMLIAEGPEGCVLDPFSGMGTTALTAAASSRHAIGIEIMPVGNLTAQAISKVANGIAISKLKRKAAEFIEYVGDERAAAQHCFPHLNITRNAFPRDTEAELSRARSFIEGNGSGQSSELLKFVCMSVLEEVSFTRKDGQYLRWDPRSGRTKSEKLNKGELPSLKASLRQRFDAVIQDAPYLKQRFSGPVPKLLDGSCLERIRDVGSQSVDLVITSPPYANRYDYTRTYALELAFLGFNDERIKRLRQDLLSATVENKSKRHWLQRLYRDSALPMKAFDLVDHQAALCEVLTALRDRYQELSNPQIIRLIENYFSEMAVVIGELARVVKPGGIVFMVNDNVQYHGQEVPVDLILSDIAEGFGFKCKNIWALRRGKGNASQQMGRFGRREIRKCIYHWERV